MNRDKLVANTKAFNSAVDCALLVRDLLHPYFSKLVGTKILKADDTIMATVKNGMPEIDGLIKTVPGGLMVYHASHLKYSLVFTVCCRVDGSYGELSVTIGNINGQILTEMRNDSIPKHVDADEIAGRIEQIQLLNNTIDKLMDTAYYAIVKR